ncbi:MAG: ribosomal protein S18-alanine N-acetyltransferase [Raoultibacter sp.]
MTWGAKQITKQAYHAEEDYAAFEAIGLQALSAVAVLDVGCFDGFNTFLKFAPYDSIERVVGIDPSKNDIERALLRYRDKRFSFICTDFESFPEDSLFDIVYMSHVLQHLSNPAAMVAKAYRLLKPGGFVIVKTTDDAAKVSFPDPDHVMRRLFDRYEQFVLPNTSWTSHTDRYCGQKCYTFFKDASLGNIRIANFVTDTVEKTLEERLELFERCVYFRRTVPPEVDGEIADEIRVLIERWHDLFLQKHYYFSSTSFVVIGQKLTQGQKPVCYRGPAFAVPASVLDNEKIDNRKDGKGDCTREDLVNAVSVRPLCEDDLGRVMHIELESFPRDPWTPLAFAMELRHNPHARYCAAVACTGEVIGYSGVWYAPDGAHLLRIAVDRLRRGCGCGTLLIDAACEQAREAGYDDLYLEVRASNMEAIAFYEQRAFLIIETLEDYYVNPSENALVMRRNLDE